MDEYVILYIKIFFNLTSFFLLMGKKEAFLLAPKSMVGIRHCAGHDWSDLACMHALEKEMATHSAILVWRISGTEEFGGLLSMGSYRVRHDWSNLAAAAALLTMPKPLTVWITTSCGKFLKWWEYQTTLPASWETCIQVKKEHCNWTWNNGLVQNWERSMSRLYIVTLLI